MSRLARWSTVAALAAVPLTASPALAQSDEPEVATLEVTLVYEDPDEIVAPVIIDRLDPTTLLTIDASGYEPDTTGSIRQCTAGAARECRSPLAVRFDDTGRAVFQYLVTDQGACRLADDRCTLELTVGRRSTVVDTVFVDAAPPPGRIEVVPNRDLHVGDVVDVRASGFAPGATLTATICVAPATSGPRCGAPAPTLALVADTDGAASGRLALDVAAVGSSRVACARISQCHVVIADDGVGVRAPPVPLDFSGRPGAAYDGSRVIVGIALAFAVLAAAAWVMIRADWSPPAEADGTAIDDAAYADLDLEIERFDRSSAEEVLGDVVEEVRAQPK